MKKKRIILLILTLGIVVIILYKLFFQEVRITHISKEDTFEYNNYETKYYLLNHFKNWNEKTKKIITLHVKEEVKHVKKGHELSLVYIINSENFLNFIFDDCNNYLVDGVDNLSSDDIAAQCYIIKDSLGNIKHKSIDFKDR